MLRPRPIDLPAPYQPPSGGPPCDLLLDGRAGLHWPDPRAGRMDGLETYPDTGELETELAARWRIGPGQVIVTAGADDALDRSCRAYLAPGHVAVLTDPTFAMLPRYAAMQGAEVRTIDWTRERLPVDRLLAAAGDEAQLMVVVTPNNPTGLAATVDELRALANRCPQTLLVIDCAYAEFADQDPTAALLKHDNVLVVRTFSKAYGLASARIGYALGSADTVATLRRVGSPYPTSSASIDRALERLRDGSGHLAMRVKRTRRERRALSALLKSIGSEVTPSQANFVLARHPRSTWLVEALAGLGIAVRGLGHGQVRLSLPASSGEFARLWRGTSAALRPEALLFDLDGVLADVRRSYRTAIKLTAHQFGVQLSDGAIATAKAWPDSNNDWRVTQRLISAAGGSASLTQVTDTFEAIMDSQRLWERERLIPALELIERLGQERPLGVVTGRPRLDAERFLSDHGLRTLFSAVVTLEDAPAKPDPAPVALALKQLGVRRAWLIGDMPDDMAAARAAGVIPLGVLAPGTSADPMTSQLTRAGAARVLSGLNQLEDLLS